MLRYGTLTIVSCYSERYFANQCVRLRIMVIITRLSLLLYLYILFNVNGTYHIASKRKRISQVYVASFVFHERSFPAILYIRNILTVVQSKRRTYHNFHCSLQLHHTLIPITKVHFAKYNLWSNTRICWINTMIFARIESSRTECKHIETETHFVLTVVISGCVQMAFRGDHLVLIELLWSDHVVFTRLNITRSEVIENLLWKAASSYK